MSQNIKVAFIINSLRFGGVEKGTVTRFNNLDNKKFSKALIYLKNEEHLLAQVNKTNGDIWCPSFKRGLNYARFLHLVNWLKKFQPNVVLCVNSYPLFYGFLARILLKSTTRLLVSFHSTLLSGKEAHLMRFLYRHIFNRADKIIYVCKAQRDYWESRGLRKDIGVVIYNGVDTDYFSNCYATEQITTLRNQFGFGSNDFVVGICAALRPEKRHGDLLEAVSRLKVRGIPAKCLIIGDGACRDQVSVTISLFGLEKDVAITGFQADVRPFVASCNCMVIVSHEVETFSNAALESMAMGKPMVMSAIGGAAEQVRDGENGYLFPAGDVDALTAALHKLADQQHCAELGARARTIVARDFGLDRMLDRYTQLFSEEG